MSSTLATADPNASVAPANEIAGDEPESAFVLPRKHPDEQLRDGWDQILAVLTMCCDMADAGAVLTIRRPEWLGAGADPVELARLGIMRKIDAILSTAKVV